MIPTLLMYYASYKLSMDKSAKEEKKDQFERLSKENERLTRELAKKDEKIDELQEELYEARKAAILAPSQIEKDKK